MNLKDWYELGFVIGVMLLFYIIGLGTGYQKGQISNESKLATCLQNRVEDARTCTDQLEKLLWAQQFCLEDSYDETDLGHFSY